MMVAADYTTCIIAHRHAFGDTHAGTHTYVQEHTHADTHTYIEEHTHAGVAQRPVAKAVCNVTLRSAGRYTGSLSPGSQ